MILLKFQPGKYVHFSFLCYRLANKKYSINPCHLQKSLTTCEHHAIYTLITAIGCREVTVLHSPLDTCRGYKRGN